MPSTRELVSIIKEDYAPSWGRTKILQYLDRVQRRLMIGDLSQTVWLNESDDSFPFPLLHTTAGNLSYDIDSSNLYDSDGNSVSPTIGGYSVSLVSVRHIFLAVASLANSNYDRKFFGEQFNLTGINEYWSQRLYRLSYFKVPGDIRDPSGLDADPRFTFHEDPGTTTDRYYVEAFYRPVQLTSESVPLSLDSNLWEGVLIDGVVGMIEDVENGRSDRLEKFRNVHVKKFRNYMNRHSNERRESQMPIRECM